jgi:hypothetical protein
MRKLKMILTAVLIFCAAGNAFGAVYSNQQDAAFRTFLAKFKTALAKKDKAAVLGLSRLPVSMPTFQKSVRTRADFLRRYNHIFNGEADAAKCFQKSPPQKVSAKEYSVACGFKNDKIGDGGEPIVYTFQLTASGWKFVGLDNINE